MLLAMLTTFAASRKEPLADVLERVHAAVMAAGFGEPQVQFILSDHSVVGGVSSVARVLKRFPQLERFAQKLAPYPGGPETRVITNRTNSETIDFATLVEIARGVPRSFPFNNVGLHFSVPAFSGATASPLLHDVRLPGIDVRDSWWVNGRQRSVTALTLVDADPSAKKLPNLPDSVAAIFTACGKVKKTIQVPFVTGLVSGPVPQRRAPETASPELAEAIQAVVHDYRTRIVEIVERAQLPHDLPSNQEAAAAGPAAVTAGPKKPELIRNFAPIGYDCRGESGTFTLRRRTPSNLTVELAIDVGTWSNLVMAIFRVMGMVGIVNGIGFKATMILPVALRAVSGGQYPIGGPESWRQIVENLAALVAELDRSFVPAIEAVSGPSPDWYRPESTT
jgi:hypothetical protein